MRRIGLILALFMLALVAYLDAMADKPHLRKVLLRLYVQSLHGNSLGWMAPPSRETES